MKKRILLALIALAFFFSAQSQEEFSRLIGTSLEDAGYSIATTSGGDFILTGISDGDLALMQLSGTSGEILWSKTFGTPGSLEQGRAVVQTAAGGLAVLGTISNTPAGQNDLVLLFTDAAGNFQSAQTYPGVSAGTGLSLYELSDGGFILSGTTQSDTDPDAVVIRTNSSGQIIWSRLIGSANPETCEQLIPTDDGGFVFTGERTAAGNAKPWVAKLDNAGNLLWAKTYGGIDDFKTTVIRSFEGGSLILAGHVSNPPGANPDPLLLQLDRNGNFNWARSFGEEGADIGHGVLFTPNRTFLLYGRTNSSGNGGFDRFVITVDLGGNLLSGFTIGLPGDERPPSGGDQPILLLNDGSLAMTGTQQGLNYGETDILFTRFSPFNFTFCGFEDWFPSLQSFGLFAENLSPPVNNGPVGKSITLESRPPEIREAERCTPPVAAFTLSDTLICAGDCVIFADSSDNFPTNWSWTFQGGTPASYDDQNPGEVCFNSAGEFVVTLIASNDFGSDTARQTIRVLPRPTIRIEGDTLLCPGETTTLTAATAPTNQVVWDDGSTTLQRQIDQEGTYWAETGNGVCTTRDTVMVVQEDCPCDIALPNAFTPDGDGKNDQFRLLSSCPVQEFSMRVYNRWGKMVFETRDPAQGWDGRSDNTLMVSDVYVYLIEVTYEDNGQRVSETLKGDVTLIR